jgi:hypothetical protein
VNEVDPSYTTINVVTQVHSVSGYVDSTVDANITQALHDYFDPQNWGLDPTITGATKGQSWIESTTVYYNEVISVISSVDGVDRVISLTLNGGTVNVALAAPAALTRLGTVAITHA